MSRTLKANSKKPSVSQPKSKTDQILIMLGRPAGASIAEMTKATGWQAHSVRGFLAGNLKKKGYTFSSEVETGGIRRYRLTTALAQS